MSEYFVNLVILFFKVRFLFYFRGRESWAVLCHRLTANELDRSCKREELDSPLTDKGVVERVV